MGAIYDTTQPEALRTGMRLARAAIERGELVVMPTDTVYGLAADAFQPDAVRDLVAAKGRTLSSPPPVLIGDLKALDALADPIPAEARRLAEACWPGALTIVLRSQPSLDWDLGAARGTVALRMPDDPIALELLAQTGPLAVSSANRTGEPPAATGRAALEALGDAVAVVLDAGRRGSVASTIVDATALDRVGGVFRVLREGGVSVDRIREVVGADRIG